MNQSPTQNISPANAVVLVVDGLGAAMLGAYGNTWFETPNLDRLAARSLPVSYTHLTLPTILLV